MKRTLGFWRCWALVVGSMIGNGVFMLPAVLAPYGAYSLLGWLFAGAGTLFIAFTLGGLARMLPRLGGPYAYTRAAFGSTPGFLVGWGHWISYVTATGAGAVAFTGYLAFFLPGVAEQPLASGLVAVALIWLMTGLNLSGVQGAGVFQTVAAVPGGERRVPGWRCDVHSCQQPGRFFPAGDDRHPGHDHHVGLRRHRERHHPR